MKTREPSRLVRDKVLKTHRKLSDSLYEIGKSMEQLQIYNLFKEAIKRHTVIPKSIGNVKEMWRMEKACSRRCFGQMKPNQNFPHLHVNISFGETTMDILLKILYQHETW